MNFYILRIDNLKLEKNKVSDVIPKSIEKDINAEGHLQYLKTIRNDKVLPLNYKQVFDKSPLKDNIGAIKYQSLFKNPVMLFMTATEEIDVNLIKNLDFLNYGKRSFQYIYFFRVFVGVFSIAAWLMKDSCISCIEAYHYNHILSDECPEYIYSIDYSCTEADGNKTETFFNSKEVERVIEWTYKIFPFFIYGIEDTNNIISSQQGGQVNYSVDQAISTNYTSYMNALISLQEARRTGVLETKIEKYCSSLESLFAIKDKKTEWVSAIASGLISNSEEERVKIKEFFRDAYKLRSERTHGDGISYLKDNSRDDLKKFSKKLDAYLRRIYKKILFNDRYNYRVNDKDEKERIRKLFKEIGRQK